MFKEIDLAISSIEVAIRNIKSSNSIRQIDKDLLLAKLRDTYDYVLALPVTKNTETIIHQSSTSQDIHKEVEKTAYIKPIVESKQIKEPSEPLEPIKKTHKLADDELLIRIEDPQNKKTGNGQTEIEHIPAPEQGITNNPSQEILISQEKEQPINIIQETSAPQISKPTQPAQQYNSTTPNPLLQSKLKPNKISDIAKAISINDKVMIVRNLYAGDNAAFNNAIAIFNAMNSLDEAMKYIQTKTTWDMEDPTVIKFIEIIKRRY